MDPARRKITIAAITIVAVIAAIGLLVAVSRRRPQTVASPDNKALAVGTVNIVYNNDNNIIIDGHQQTGSTWLNLKSVELTTPSEDTKPSKIRRVVTLDFGTATLKFELSYSGEHGNLLADNVYLALHGSDKKEVYNCYMPEFQFEIAKNERYSCKKKMAYTCNNMAADSRDNVQVILPKLEFEIEGNVAKISKGEFSKQPSEKSCV